MVDVGFGGDGPIVPVPLIDGQVTQNIGSQQMRMVHGSIPLQTTGTEGEDENKKLWIFQNRNGTDRPWNSFYSFPEIEFFQQDFEHLNFFISRSPDSFQTYRMLIVKFLRRAREEADSGDTSTLPDVIYGKVMLVNGDVKLNTGGRTSIVKTCATEAERIEALREYFGITLSEEERESIRGFSTELGVGNPFR